LLTWPIITIIASTCPLSAVTSKSDVINLFADTSHCYMGHNAIGQWVDLELSCAEQAQIYWLLPRTYDCSGKDLARICMLSLRGPVYFLINSFPVMVRPLSPHHFLVFGHILVNFGRKIKVDSVLETGEPRAHAFSKVVYARHPKRKVDFSVSTSCAKNPRLF
jgi:hypothetical protein